MPQIALALALLLAARPASAKPGWAGADDKADARGHTFVCEGSGTTEEDALAAAQGICNDKICKVCGVEVESVVETKETLKGVELQRKVVERCRRVRTRETKVQYKSTDCGPEGCTAWIQIFYSKDDEKAECPAYASEKFADPLACEKEIDDFRNATGRHAADLRKRLALLEAALGDCAQIDVRPTPAIMALDEKLRVGLARVEQADREAESWRFYQNANAFVKAPATLSQQIAETKLLVDRIRLVRDFVQNRLLVIEVVDAFDRDDWDTPAGLEPIMKALARAPKGSQFGTPWVHYYFARLFETAKSDKGAYNAFVRSTYAPSEVPSEYMSAMSFVLRADDVVTPDEWAYARAMAPGRKCLPCLRWVLQAKSHEPKGTRVARLVEALEAAAADAPERQRERLFYDLVPYGDAAFVLDAEKLLPPAWRAHYGLKLYDEMLSRIEFPPVRAEARVVARRIADVLVAGPVDQARCHDLVGRIPKLARYGVPVADFDGRVCECLEGPLAKEGISGKTFFYERALEKELPCVQ